MKNLFKQLASFQQEVPVILKDTQGYGYKYADLPQIFTVINPLLKKYDLGFTQLIEGTSIKTILFHTESGEKLESLTEIPQGVSLKGMNDFQVLGSAITYIRRYALSSILGLVTDKDTDGDGEQEKTTPNVTENKPWLNIYKKGTKDLTPEMTEVYKRMKEGKLTSLADIRKEYAVNKTNAVTIDAWFKKLQKTA